MAVLYNCLFIIPRRDTARPHEQLFPALGKTSVFPTYGFRTLDVFYGQKMRCVTFCAWLLSLSTVLLGSVYTVVCVNTSLLSVAIS